MTILGQIQGPNPSLKALRAWAFSTLHDFLKSFAQVGKGFFETRFSFELGCKHTFEKKSIMKEQM